MKTIQCTTSPVYYHGSEASQLTLDATRRNEDGAILCLSASVNVARRYGPFVHRFRLRPCTLGRMSVTEWMNSQGPLSKQVPAIIVERNQDAYDFPEDMLVLLNTNIISHLGTLQQDELTLLDDGHPFLHQPVGPSDRGFAHWVASHHRDCLGAALEDLGNWRVLANGGFEGHFEKESGWLKDYRVTVSPNTSGDFSSHKPWMVDDNWEERAVDYCETVFDAVRIADLRMRKMRRNAISYEHPTSQERTHDFNIELSAA